MKQKEVKELSSLDKEIRQSLSVFVIFCIAIVICGILLTWKGIYVKTINTTAEIIGITKTETSVRVDMNCKEIDSHVSVKDDMFFTVYAYYNTGETVGVTISEYNKFGKLIYVVDSTDFSKENLHVELIKKGGDK